MIYDNFSLALDLLPGATLDTLYMVFFSSLFALVLGLPLGVALHLFSKGQIKENLLIHKILSSIVNIGRSFPFAILMIALIPLTRYIVGTSLGTTAAIVPLTIASAPFLARLIEQSLQEVDKNILETASIMGATTYQTITKFLFNESLPSLIKSFFNTVIGLIGYSTMSGLIGGGGLGKVAVQYGYHQFNVFIMTTTVIVLIFLVEIIQLISDSMVRTILKRRGLLANE
ncbi:MAG: ABC transporter permease [Chlamydiae bacterium]|nr:ABC transporter permease [Chlamydiota bacterium]